MASFKDLIKVDLIVVTPDVLTSDPGELHLLTRPVRLVEGQRFILNTDVLLAWDSSGLPQELVYTVTVPPWHGLVSLVNRPGVAMVTFTQLDVSAQRLCYTHDNSHEHESDSFRSDTALV